MSEEGGSESSPLFLVNIAIEQETKTRCVEITAITIAGALSDIFVVVGGHLRLPLGAW